MPLTIRPRTLRRILFPAALSLAFVAQADSGWVSTATPQALIPLPVPGCEYAGSNAWSVNSAFYGNVFYGGTDPYCVDASGLAPLDPDQPLHLVISLKLRHRPELLSFLHDVVQPGSAVYGQYLSRAQFQGAYAPTPAQALKVATYLVASGFTHVEVAPNRLLVAADGTVGQASKAFNTTMKRWSLYGATGYGSASPVQVPAALGDLVDVVQGLPGLGRGSKYHAALPLPSTPVAGNGYSPVDYAGIYNASGVGPGTATPVAVIAQGDMSQTISDLSVFTTSHQLPTVPTTVIATGSGPLGEGSAHDESQAIVGAAGGLAGLSFYAMPNSGSAPTTADLTWAYNRAVADDTAKIIQSSWQVEEPIAYLSGAQQQDDAIFMAAQAQGQVFVAPIGEANQVNAQINDVYQFPPEPATSPYVVAIGGSQANTDSSKRWNGETLWSELSALDSPGNTAYDYWYSHSGYSLHEPVPPWQAAQALTVRPTPNQPVQLPTTQRYVPDLAFDAHMAIPGSWPNADTPAGPTNGARIIVGGVEHHLYNGTELAAAVFAGLFARVESAHGNALGLPTPQMYASFAQDRTPLHDFSAPATSPYNYQCPPPSWTACSGWGSLDIGKFNAYVTQHWGL
ncbi:hypothetical protein KK141_08080 [Dyella sp. LX-66]|uniref:S53 family peptidase n=1 Tax=unclassified Dyella TaxID=2634549 RepID=UPI001BDFF8F2|nr:MULTISPECIES: protease pro-enzyme activation domain-containing protein [unclassified Dyella]MBT2115673.1 hypothetical protein [Dyella sp. LX-1]MBT2139488.1 hypothetical protein [Dyella sp. LX-66]